MLEVQKALLHCSEELIRWTRSSESMSEANIREKSNMLERLQEEEWPGNV